MECVHADIVDNSTRSASQNLRLYELNTHRKMSAFRAAASSRPAQIVAQLVGFRYEPPYANRTPVAFEALKQPRLSWRIKLVHRRRTEVQSSSW